MDADAQYQGDTSACGTVSLAEIQDFWAGRRGAHPHVAIDAALRRHVDVGTSPTLLLAWAQAHGLRAGARNHGSWRAWLGDRYFEAWNWVP